MAFSPAIRTTQARVAGAVEFAVDIQVTQAFTLTAINFPAEFTQTTQARVNVVLTPVVDVQVTQARILAAVRGRVANPQLRAWTFSMDGHDFYVLQLGDSATLVYDLYSEQWVDWADFDKSFWRVRTGINWNGGTGLAHQYGSNVLVGDDTFGLLWFLDPGQPYDQHPNYLSPTQEVYFGRITMGQIAIRGREVFPCFATWLTTDMGNPAYDGASVRLEISDDGGISFDDMGTVEVEAGILTPEISWYSLGQISAPGRLFKITDDGAIARIDGMEMNDPDDDDGG